MKVSIRSITGFTLLELMMTVAVLSLIGAIAVPLYQGYAKEAQIGSAIHDIRQIELLVADYALSNGVYPDDLSEVEADRTRDPWGRPYQYLNIADSGEQSNRASRKDHNMVPVNSDFDLYSVGADGKSSAPFTAKNSHDDIVRANNGAFVGLAEDY